MTSPYATSTQLNAWLADPFQGDPTRILARASEVIDAHIRAPYDIDDEGIPTDPDTAAALADATCAQVEFWVEVGEDHDVTGLANRPISVGSLNVSALPPELAPRAARILANAGLFTMDTLTLGWGS